MNFYLIYLVFRIRRLNDLKKKLKSKQNDAAEMKKIMPDTISKAALMHNQDYFNSIMNDV